MSSFNATLQRITVLSPLAVIASRLEHVVSPVAIATAPPETAVGAVFADDIAAPVDLPPRASALHDGWAVQSEETADASSYAPAIPNSTPVWVDAGQQMPAETDSVLPFDAVRQDSGHTELLASAVHGDGVLQAKADASGGTIVCKKGNRVRSLDVAILRALSIDYIPIRMPRVKIIALSVGDPRSDFVSPVIANLVRENGGAPEIVREKSLEAVVAEGAYDAIITIGGTGAGKNDSAVQSLAQIGSVEFHGFGIAPGQTAALGRALDRPVLMLPGRIDSALAVFLVVGRRLMARLSGSNEDEPGSPTTLVKKVTSTIGLEEVIFVRRVAGGIEPLGSGMFPLHVLNQAHGWILVPAVSEGIAAGSTVDMRSLA